MIVIHKMPKWTIAVYMHINVAANLDTQLMKSTVAKLKLVYAYQFPSSVNVLAVSFLLMK